MMKDNEEQSKETLEKWHKDPKNWQWGIFYFNKDDKRLLPPKRIERMGYTVNFANPTSILFIVALCLIPTLLIMLLKVI